MCESTILPSPLAETLRHVGSKLADRRRIGGDLASLPELLGAVSVSDFPRAEREIVSAACLYSWRRPMTYLERLFGRTVFDTDQLKKIDGLEYLFIFHRDGRLREAALQKLSGPLPNAFLFTAIAWRLNDWAPAVRVAAADCARQTFPQTPAAIVAQAAIVLMLRKATWNRWGPEEAILEEAFSRPDVAACLAASISNRSTGRMASLLRQALRASSMDKHLPLLAQTAVQPSVRAAATQCLLNECAEWPVGWHWKWIDKSMGVRRKETTFARRSLTIPVDLEAVIRRGLSDRAGAVRSIAMSGLIRHRADIRDALQLATGMLADKSTSVRARAEFALRCDLPSE